MRKDSNDPAKTPSPERQGDHGRTSVLRWGGLAGILGGLIFILVFVIVIVFVGPDPAEPEGGL